MARDVVTYALVGMALALSGHALLDWLAYTGFVLRLGL